MIGEISSRSVAPGGPASTGKQRCRVHRDTASVAAGGGSSNETNWPPIASAMTWVPISDRAIASSLSAAAAPVFATRTETRCSASSGSTLTVNAALTSRRCRTSRPPSTSSISVAGGDGQRERPRLSRIVESKRPEGRFTFDRFVPREPRTGWRVSVRRRLRSVRHRCRARCGGAAVAGSAPPA